MVVAVRADHLAGLAAVPDLAATRRAGPAPGQPARRATRCARRSRPGPAAGLRFEHGLVDLLVRDAEGEPGALPLLSHASWRRGSAATATCSRVEGYRATGGIRGAVARSADRLYDSLAAEQRAVCAR